MRKIRLLICLIMLFAVPLVAVADTNGHWAEKYIEEIKSENIMSGNGVSFMPDKNISRAEFVVAIIRALGAKPKSATVSFSDIKADSFYAPYIISAAEIGIISGYDDGTFRPENNLTREESVIILSRAFGFLSGYNIGAEFSDRNSVTEGARSAFAYALNKGIIKGYPDKTLRPKGNLSRAEAAVLIIGARGARTSEPGFVMGYPRLAEIGEYGKMRLEVCTNMPCNIYYAVSGAELPGIMSSVNINKQLTSTIQANRQRVAEIEGEIGKRYNIYLMAVTPDGKKSNVIKISDVTPLPFASGDGTKEKPYSIKTQDELSAIRFFNDKAFVLENDIKLEGEWEPIENFYGSIDGVGYRIDDLVVNTDSSYAGLFRRITKGEIKNLTVDGQVKARANAGIIAGEFLDAKITSCTVSGRVGVVTNNAGGLFGESAGRIENCLSGVYMVEAGSFAGGIAGQNYGIIKNSLSAAYTVVADIYAGGIASVNVGGKIENCVAASVYVYDMLLGNCGRVTTNKKDSDTICNYAYSGMITTSESGVNEINNGNGADLLWEELIDIDKLCGLLGWNKSDWTGGGRSEAYLLPRPLGTKSPELISGTTEYTPIRVSTAEELLGMIDNPDKHYLLVDNLYFGTNLKWRPAADTDVVEEGFSGTLDGGGKTIYNLITETGENGNCGLFGVVYGGTVRNLNLTAPRYTGGEIIGAIAAVNYGTIENCSVNDLKIKAGGQGSYAGGIAGYNYGTIKVVTTSGDIESGAKNTVIGGICAHNEGFVDDATFSGTVKTSKMGGVSESVVGGICGYNSGGMICNTFSSADIRQQATTMYSGGTCAIQNDGEVYKCSSMGNIITEQPGKAIAIAYSGGVNGLAAGGIVMNSFSGCDIKQYTLKSYAGGVCGYNETAIIQNTYATGSILQTNDAEIKKDMPSYAGGICGFNENGTVSASVAVNPSISSYGVVARICPDGTSEQIYGNYAVKMDIVADGEGNYGGTTVSNNRIGVRLFTTPLSEGGILGWSKEVWIPSSNHSYDLPVLAGVRNQAAFL
ncbi:MAG: S-layer homology domain-containing protein [Eubacteriales bacterium]|nr:S-layer homology domain-containing protein [Eubacteriales bacterium]